MLGSSTSFQSSLSLSEIIFVTVDSFLSRLSRGPNLLVCIFLHMLSYICFDNGKCERRSAVERKLSGKPPIRIRWNNFKKKITFLRPSFFYYFFFFIQSDFVKKKIKTAKNNLRYLKIDEDSYCNFGGDVIVSRCYSKKYNRDQKSRHLYMEKNV